MHLSFWEHYTYLKKSAEQCQRKQNQNGNRVPSSSSSSASGDPILRAAGMSQWCSAFLHVVRVFSERLLPPVMVRPHTSMSNVHTPLHLKHLMDEFRMEGQTAVSTSIDLSCLFCYCIVTVLFRIVSYCFKLMILPLFMFVFDLTPARYFYFIFY